MPNTRGMALGEHDTKVKGVIEKNQRPSYNIRVANRKYPIICSPSQQHTTFLYAKFILLDQKPIATSQKKALSEGNRGH